MRRRRWVTSGKSGKAGAVASRARLPIRQPRALVAGFGLLGLISAACSKALDLGDYEFPAAEQSPPLPLGPAEDAGMTSKPSEPVRDAGTVSPPPVQPGGGIEPTADAGPPGPVGPLPRPVVIGEPDPTLALQGSLTGGEPRAATCSGGVIIGLVYQYYVSTSVQPDRLSYVWPLCAAVEPGTPLLLEGVSLDETWLTSSPEDPVFAALREGENIDAIACPPNHYVVGVDGSFDALEGTALFRSMGIQCAPFATTTERSDVVLGPLVSVSAPGIAPLLGATSFTQLCATGTVATQLDLRFGLWLDAMGLRCATIQWPLTIGQSCSSGQECQTGTCEAARCAP
jgi:hypothetical protein